MISTSTTVIVLCTLSILAVAYDIVAEIKDNKFSISFVLGSAARKAPIIVLVIGVIIGHWFWGQCLN